MLILLSPAKTMTGTSKIKAPQGTTPRFQQEANEIALHMTQFPIDELSRILKLSPKLAAECYRRYQDFHAEDNQPLQAILAYTGVVFKNISPKDFTEEDFLFSQKHMRFVSGCYGLLRPLDLIKPYRMEFDVKIPELGDGNMYAFWKDLRTEPFVIRESYGRAAVDEAVREGVREYGDDFGLQVCRMPAGHGAGATFDSEDRLVTEWYQRTDEQGEPVDYDYETGQYIDSDVDGVEHETPDGRSVPAHQGVRTQESDRE